MIRTGRRRQALLALAAAVAGGVAVPSSASAIRDVRVDFTNATDRAAETYLWRGGAWRPVGTVRPDETRRNLTSGTSTLYLWIDGCGQIKVDNPTIGAPYGGIRRGNRADGSRGIDEGDRTTLEIPALRVSVSRDDDTDDFKELAVTLIRCSFDDALPLPDRPGGRSGEPEWQPK